MQVYPSSRAPHRRTAYIQILRSTIYLLEPLQYSQSLLITYLIILVTIVIDGTIARIIDGPTI
jgi:hypothetical protein